jgi:hypothetical protein
MSLTDYAPFEFTLIPPPAILDRVEQILEFQWPKSLAAATFYH